jgi:hypothetical protein
MDGYFAIDSALMPMAALMKLGQSSESPDQGGLEHMSFIQALSLPVRLVVPPWLLAMMGTPRVDVPQLASSHCPGLAKVRILSLAWR